MNSLPNRPLQRARLGALVGGIVLVAATLAVPTAALAATPTALAFQVQPGGGASSASWSQQPVVKIVDGGGATVTTSTASVTLAVGNNPSGGLLSCAGGLTVAAVNGVATFSGCQVNVAGSAYTLLATAAGLSAATSASFDIGASPPATQNRLAFAVASVNPPPLTGTAGVGLNFVFSVRINDPSDTLITSGPFATAPVTLAMTPNAVAASVSCPGGLTVNAVGGIAEFPGCVVTAPGTGLSFTATSPGSATATSPRFNILAGGASPVLTIAASRSVILWGEGIDLTVQLTAPAGSSASVANRTIHVQVARVHAPGDFATINPGGDVVTDATGRATITGYTPATNLWYRAIYDGSTDIGPVASAETRVVVRQLAAIKPDNAGTTRTIAKGTSIEFRTVVRPTRDDVPRTHVTWQLWRLVNNKWTLFLTQVSDPDVTGLAFFTVGFNTGSWRLRSQAQPTQLNANSAWTPYVQFLVK